MNVAGAIILVIFLLLIAAAAGWVVFTRVRASRLGLPPPSLSSYLPFRKSPPALYGPPQPAPGGIVGWINDRVRLFKQGRNQRTAVGAYESHTLGGEPRGGRRGFGPLDPDEAWDARVGHEADTYGPGGYYEEQELGLHPPHSSAGGGNLGVGPYGNTEYSGSSYAMNVATTPGDASARFGEQEQRGRTRSRSPGGAAGSGMPGGAAGRNPFDDDAAEVSSLRGVSPRPIDTAAADPAAKKDGDSPTERRSVFRENM